MNLVKRFFADLTADVIRTGSFGSVKELVDDINAYLAERNANPRPYRWKAKGEAILEKSIAPKPPSKGSRPRELLVTICESGRTRNVIHAFSKPTGTRAAAYERDAAASAARGKPNQPISLALQLPFDNLVD
jgi:hypothetical protein